MFILKEGQPDIEIVDGPFKGRHFVAGVEYPEVPPEEEGRFEKVEKVMEAEADQGKENTGGEVE